VIRTVIADDHDDLRLLLSLALRRDERFEVVATAADGEEALDLIAAHQPDLLLLDLAMPKKDGYEVLASAAAAGRPVVVILSGFSGEEVADRVRELGAAGQLVKGIDLKTMCDQLATIYQAAEESGVRG